MLNRLVSFKNLSLQLFFRSFLVSCLSILSNETIQAQTIPVTDLNLQEQVRVKQLEGEIDSSISLNVNPMVSYNLGIHTDNLNNRFSIRDLISESKTFEFKILPIGLNQQYNSHHAYGWNDGLMIPAKAYQVLFSAGVFTRFGPLSIQLMPEALYASNPRHLDQADQIASDAYSGYISTADIPQYYWAPNYSNLTYGQSSIRLTFDPVSFGISNENLRWGPGRRNSLVMSPGSRGFKHLTLNTSKPVRTPIGSLEGQIITGRLEQSDDPSNLSKVNEWRYLSGMVFNYQPLWVPGLSLGLSRVFQMYHSDVEGAADYFPLFQAFEKNKTDEDNKRRDQLTSVFARLLIPNAGAEIYTEFARNDHSVDIRDFTMEPNHSRAYLVGFQKLSKLKKLDERLLIGAEITQLSQAPTRHVRDAGTFYTHGQILQGYTHRGEVLGAGIGPGGNIQTLEFSWLKGFKKLGIQFERFVHNNDYYQWISRGDGDKEGQWVDLSAGILIKHDYKNLLVSGELLGIQSFNYLWQSGYHGTPNKDVFNIHARIGLSYYFK